MEHIFAPYAAILTESRERLQKVCVTYQGKKRQEEFDKVYAELAEWYDDTMQDKGDWMRSAMDYQDKLRAARATIATLRTELSVAHDRLADIAEHYDELHESDIPALGFLNLKEKA